MNRIRITGLVLIVIGLILPYILQNDIMDFFTGLLIGLGVGLLFIGKIKKTNTKHVSH